MQVINDTKRSRKLLGDLGDEIIDALIESKAMIAGGSITSVFTNSSINDYDIYFHTYLDLSNFLEKFVSDKVTIVSVSDKAILGFHKSNKDEISKIQLIYFKVFPRGFEEIFESFDFTVCMGGYDLATYTFYLDDRFLMDLSSKELIFNNKTNYPFISLVRVLKYQGKGFTISRVNLLQILMVCLNTKVKNYGELKEHLSGMYGYSHRDLFKDFNDSDEVDYTDVINKMQEMIYEESEFFNLENTSYSVTDIIEKIYTKANLQFGLYAFGNNYYTDSLRVHKITPSNKHLFNPTDIGEMFNPRIAYKFVKRIPGKEYFVSHYRNSFEYRLGEVSSDNTGKGIFVYYPFGLSNNPTYSTEKDTVLIECEILDEVLPLTQDINYQLIVNRVKPIRVIDDINEVKKSMLCKLLVGKDDVIHDSIPF